MWVRLQDYRLSRRHTLVHRPNMWNGPQSALDHFTIVSLRFCTRPLYIHLFSFVVRMRSSLPTGFNQSSPVQPVSETGKSQKFTFFDFFVWKKKCYPLSFPILGGRNLTRALQSSPFQNPGGAVRVWRRMDGRVKKEILVSNLGCVVLISVFIQNMFEQGDYCYKNMVTACFDNLPT